MTVVIDLIKDSHKLSTDLLVHFVRTRPSVVGKLQQTRGAKYLIKMVNPQQHPTTLPNSSTLPGEEGYNDDATLADDGFIMSLNGKHNISPGGRSARHNSSKDVKKSTKETSYTKLTSLAVAASQSNTKAPRRDNNVVTAEKDAVPPRSTRHPTTSTNSFIQSYHTTMAKEQTVIDSTQASEDTNDSKLVSIVKKLDFTNDESKHKMQSWGDESSDDEDDEDAEDDEDDEEEEEFDEAAYDKEHQSTYFSSTRGCGRGRGYGDSGRGYGRGRGAGDRLGSTRSQASLDRSAEQYNDADEYPLASSSDNSTSSEEDVGPPTKPNSRKIVIDDVDEGRSLLDMSMISEIGDEPSVSEYPSYSMDESTEKKDDEETDALLNQIFAPNAQDHLLMTDNDNTDHHDYRTTHNTHHTTTVHNADDNCTNTVAQTHENNTNNEKQKKKKKKKKRQSTHEQEPLAQPTTSADYSMHALLTKSTDDTTAPTPVTTTTEPNPVPNLNENNSSRTWETVKLSFQFERTDECSNLLDQGHIDYDIERFTNHPVLSTIGALIRKLQEKQSDVLFQTSKSNEVMDSGFFSRSWTNNDIKGAFNYNLIHRNSNPNQTNLSVIVKMSLGGFESLWAAKTSILKSYLNKRTIFMHKHADAAAAIVTTNIGFLCAMHPAHVHVSTLQKTINAKAQQLFTQDEKYKNVARRYKVDSLEQLPLIVLNRSKTRVFRSKTDHVQIDAIQVLVPTELRAMYRVMFHDMAKGDESFELCDRAYLENPQLREIYYRQVIVYKRFLQDHYVIRIHGCSTPDMEAIMDDITLAGIISISPTDKLKQRGLWHLLAHKSLSQESKQQIDTILTQLNVHRPHGPSDFPDYLRSRYRSSDNQSRVDIEDYQNLVQKYVDVAPDPEQNSWDKPLFATSVSDASVVTAVTTSLDMDKLHSIEKELSTLKIEIVKMKQEKNAFETRTRDLVQTGRDDAAETKTRNVLRIGAMEALCDQSNKTVKALETRVDDVESKVKQVDEKVSNMVTVADLESSIRNLEQSMTASITNVITDILSRQQQQQIPRQTEHRIVGSMINNNTGSGAVNNFTAPSIQESEARSSSKHGWRRWLNNSTSKVQKRAREGMSQNHHAADDTVQSQAYDSDVSFSSSNYDSDDSDSADSKPKPKRRNKQRGANSKHDRRNENSNHP